MQHQKHPLLHPGSVNLIEQLVFASLAFGAIATFWIAPLMVYIILLILLPHCIFSE